MPLLKAFRFEFNFIRALVVLQVSREDIEWEANINYHWNNMALKLIENELYWHEIRAARVFGLKQTDEMYASNNGKLLLSPLFLFYVLVEQLLNAFFFSLNDMLMKS